MRNVVIDYTPERILRVLQEEHRLGSMVDFEVDDGLEITRDTSIKDWRLGMDFLPWHKLHKVMNEMFRITVPYSKWKKAVLPERKKKLSDLCIFLSKYAKQEIPCPVNLLGKECMAAAVFLTFKKNLSQRGLEVQSLRPSTPLKSFLNRQTLPWLLAELALTGVRTLELLEATANEFDFSTFWQRIRGNVEWYSISTGSTKTFGDLAKLIAVGLQKDN